MKYIKENATKEEIEAYFDALKIKLKSGWSFRLSCKLVGISQQKRIYALIQDNRFKDLWNKNQPCNTRSFFK